MSTIANYYDEYSDRQAKVGINARHHSIQKWLEKFGLKKTDRILEIGCGIGTQTQLLAEYLDNSDQITAVDISPKSVEVGKKMLANFKGIKWIVADFVNYTLDEQFDVVLLPDVIEHIPLNQHKALFANIKKVLKPTGWVLIHIPAPNFLEWCHKNWQDKLQVLDQPIYTDELTQNVYPNGFYIDYLQTYSIWIDLYDYQVIVLKPLRKDLTYALIPTPPHVELWNKIVWKSRQLLGLKN
jgi:trans-aconitate 2-methyltransferase